MRIVGLGIDKVVPHSHAPTLVGSGIVEQPRTDGPRVVPESASGARVESEYIVRRSHVHHAAHYDRSRLQPLRIARVEDPCGAQLRDIGFVDFFQSAVAPSGVVSVIRSPVLADGPRQQIFGTYMNRRLC